MPLTQDDDFNWGQYAIQNNWHCCEDYAKAKWYFANSTRVIPYGSYVLVDDKLYFELELYQKIIARKFKILLDFMLPELEKLK